MKHKIRDPGPVWQLISAFIFVYADLFLCALMVWTLKYDMKLITLLIY